MLLEISIKNFAIIEEIALNFETGMTVLTGETGAGKSIILSGINLLIGEKASVDMIRDGEENLVAQGRLMSSATVLLRLRLKASLRLMKTVPFSSFLRSRA